MATERSKTSPEVAKHATQKATLGQLALIGVFGTVSEPGALIRTPTGTFKRVTVGDTLNTSTVAAIGDDTVILKRASHTRTLRLPKT